MSVGREQSISLANRIDDVSTLGPGLVSCCAVNELVDEFIVASEYFRFSFLIYKYVGIRLFQMVSASLTAT